MRMLAKVPRTITSSLPRREPYELKSFGSTPRAIRYLPAGESFLIAPAGEMWSVVMESPAKPMQYAPLMSACFGRSIVMPSTYGGFLMYVDFASHAYWSPSGTSTAFHSLLPLNTL